MKNNIKKYVVIFICFVFVIFCVNYANNNSVYADSSSHSDSSSHGGTGGSFGNGSSSSSNSSSDAKEKTGKSVEDANKLGENTLDGTSGTLDGTSGTLTELGNIAGNGTEGGTPDHDQRYGNFNTVLYRIWGVILVVLQVASMAGIIFAGVRYMFASADSKADLKNSMIYLVIGMVIVFGASSVVGFVTGTFKNVFSPLL